MTAAASDPAYTDAIVDLLGLLAYGELSAFSRLAADAEMAPNARSHDRFARLALLEFGHYQAFAERLRACGGDLDRACAPYVGSFAAYHERTRPRTWLEAVVKAYVGDGIARDFTREIAAYVDPQTATLMREATADTTRTPVLLSLAREGMAVAPASAGRLALWARRLHGEAVAQAQLVAAEHDGLTRLLTGQFGGMVLDLGALGELFERLTARHSERLTLLGLTA